MGIDTGHVYRRIAWLCLAFWWHLHDASRFSAAVEDTVYKTMFLTVDSNGLGSLENALSPALNEICPRGKFFTAELISIKGGIFQPNDWKNPAPATQGQSMSLIPGSSGGGSSLLYYTMMDFVSEYSKFPQEICSYETSWDTAKLRLHSMLENKPCKSLLLTVIVCSDYVWSAPEYVARSFSVKRGQFFRIELYGSDITNFASKTAKFWIDNTRTRGSLYAIKIPKTEEEAEFLRLPLSEKNEFHAPNGNISLWYLPANLPDEAFSYDDLFYYALVQYTNRSYKELISGSYMKSVTFRIASPISAQSQTAFVRLAETITINLRATGYFPASGVHKINFTIVSLPRSGDLIDVLNNRVIVVTPYTVQIDVNADENIYGLEYTAKEINTFPDKDFTLIPFGVDVEDQLITLDYYALSSLEPYAKRAIAAIDFKVLPGWSHPLTWINSGGSSEALVLEQRSIYYSIPMDLLAIDSYGIEMLPVAVKFSIVDAGVQAQNIFYRFNLDEWVTVDAETAYPYKRENVSLRDIVVFGETSDEVLQALKVGYPEKILADSLLCVEQGCQQDIWLAGVPLAINAALNSLQISSVVSYTIYPVCVIEAFEVEMNLHEETKGFELVSDGTFANFSFVACGWQGTANLCPKQVSLERQSETDAEFGFLHILLWSGVSVVILAKLLIIIAKFFFCFESNRKNVMVDSVVNRVRRARAIASKSSAVVRSVNPMLGSIDSGGFADKVREHGGKKSCWAWRGKKVNAETPTSSVVHDEESGPGTSDLEEVYTDVFDDKEPGADVSDHEEVASDVDSQDSQHLSIASESTMTQV